MPVDRMNEDDTGSDGLNCTIPVALATKSFNLDIPGISSDAIMTIFNRSRFQPFDYLFTRT